MQTNPEQWALDLLTDIIDIGGLGGPCSEADCVECGKVALKIQAAFAEREARLVAALKEPTDAMIEAGEELISERKAFGCRVYAADIWRAMFSTEEQPLAALKDRTDG